MRITLDQDTWTIADDVPFADALTELSNRARAGARLVTALTVGGRPLTDRDLHPSLLQEPVGRLGPVEATTQTLAAVLRSADASARRMAETLHAEGAKLAVALRGGGQGFAALDAWLGGLAD